jgi:hypothetical protein
MRALQQVRHRHRERGGHQKAVPAGGVTRDRSGADSRAGVSPRHHVAEPRRDQRELGARGECGRASPPRTTACGQAVADRATRRSSRTCRAAAPCARASCSFARLHRPERQFGRPTSPNATAMSSTPSLSMSPTPTPQVRSLPSAAARPDHERPLAGAVARCTGTHRRRRRSRRGALAYRDGIRPSVLVEIADRRRRARSSAGSPRWRDPVPSACCRKASTPPPTHTGARAAATFRQRRHLRAGDDVELAVAVHVAGVDAPVEAVDLGSGNAWDASLHRPCRRPARTRGPAE